MSDIKTKVQGLDPNVKARDVHGLARDTQNVYEALAIITKRSKQLAVELKHELHQKLEEFAVTSDAIEEISENKEQIEISKFYERLPNPVVIASEEYVNGELYHRYNNKTEEEEL
ncbi:DNA-directed RNA polymerase subunit omega [Phaeodactylibacter luteus]|uniref:DNA-directed RNA polymerase subunit omega n=1 Tax=Phaeodactylibacter luteus TaxID=1564516 RepID=A0A5C6RJM5_9BACT|nr:DNA-directed RNA polymerase subunit omega [Phaeodactylibacter luteus]TXB62541.1 DNA-directed RNA polymerase subunit omega [Phaeodactylibacter luteus]